MALTSSDEHYRYLISCIRHSSNGKVDFEEVRKEFCIVSKGAAAKLYERMMKAHDTHPGQNSTIVSDRNTAFQSRREAFQNIVGPSKKRKRERYVDRPVNQNDDGECPNHRTEGSNKKSRKDMGQTKEDESVQ